MNITKVKEALAPSARNQAAYTAKVAQKETVTVIAEDGTPIQQEVTFYISWDSICQILAMARIRAGF